MPRVSKAQLQQYEKCVTGAIAFTKQDPTGKNLVNNVPLMVLCECICEHKDDGPQCALSSLEKFVKDKDPITVSAALSVLDNCVKFCDYRFHKQLATPKWMERLIRIVDNAKTNEQVKHKILQLLSDWRDEYKDEPGLVAFQRAGVDLTRRGLVLPQPTDPVMRAPDPEIYMSIRRSTRRMADQQKRTALPDDWKAQLDMAPASSAPAQEENDHKMLAHLIPEMDDLYYYMEMLGDFLSKSIHNQKAQSAADACRTWLRRIQALLSSEASEDVIVELLEINYELLRLLELWDIMDTSNDGNHYQQSENRGPESLRNAPFNQENFDQAIRNESYWRDKCQAAERSLDEARSELRKKMKVENPNGSSEGASADPNTARKVNELETQLTQLNERLKRHTKRESKYKLKWQEKDLQNKTLLDQIKMLDGGAGGSFELMQELTRQREEMQKTDKALKDQLTDERKNSERLQLELIAYQERSSLLEHQGEGAQSELQRIRGGGSNEAVYQQLTEEQTAHSQTRTQNAQLVAQLAILEKETARIRNSDSDTSSRAQDLAIKASGLEAENADLRRRLTAVIAVRARGLEERVKAIKKDVADMRHAMKTMARKVKDESATLETTIINGVLGYAKKFESLEAENLDLMKKYKTELATRKRLYNVIQELKGKIRVFCRVRPISSTELAGGHTDVTSYGLEEANEICITNPANGRKTTFEFDQIFHPANCTQASIFENVEPLVTSILDGYNVCVFAYGQTGSGKTFTMEGPAENRGINYRTLQNLFDAARERTPDFQYDLEVSVLEIYNEQIRDLLVRGGSSEKLDIRHVGATNVEVGGLTRRPVPDLNHVLRIMEEGQHNRSTGKTNMNEHSSRSHCVTSIYASGINVPTKMTSVGKLHLIDLAGSERIGKSEATGARLEEANFINKSLSALGDVIQALSQKDRSHIPFRNSKLTHLLQDSLGGSAKTLMFVNISPASYNTVETLCSLNFAGGVRTVELGQAKKNTGGDGAASAAGSRPGKKK